MTIWPLTAPLLAIRDKSLKTRTAARTPSRWQRTPRRRLSRIGEGLSKGLLFRRNSERAGFAFDLKKKGSRHIQVYSCCHCAYGFAFDLKKKGSRLQTASMMAGAPPALPLT